MRIDRTHRNWAVASLLLFGASTLLYGIYRVSPANSPMGGTPMGLAFGSVGFAFMIFSALLGARKKVPVWRVGRAQTWMRGHLWLGLLSLPLIIFHSGLRYGHGLTAVLMTLLIFVVASGLFGAALQHYMPRVMTREVTMETIYEEIEHVRAQATAEPAKVAAAGETGSPAAAVAVREDQAAALRNFFEQELQPFLQHPGARGHALADAAHSRNYERSCRPRCTPRSKIWKAFAKRNASFRCRRACICGCMAGCCCTFPFRWR